VSIHDIQRLSIFSLKISSIADEPNLNTKEDWTAVLKLSCLFDFASLRTFAIAKLFPITKPVDKIVLARKYGMKQWLRDAYLDVCMAATLPIEDDGEALGFPTFRKIALVREILDIRQSIQPRVPISRNCDVVADIFGLGPSYPFSLKDVADTHTADHLHDIPENLSFYPTTSPAKVLQAEREELVRALEEACHSSAAAELRAEQAKSELRHEEDRRKVVEEENCRMVERLQAMEATRRVQEEQACKSHGQDVETWQAVAKRRYRAGCEAEKRRANETGRKKNRATESQGRRSSGAGVSSGDLPTLRVTHISEHVAEHDLRNLFGSFGLVTRVQIDREGTSKLDRRFALVSFEDQEVAQWAKENLHGYGYDNCTLDVQWGPARES
jgi:hypothetical protein